MNEQNDDDMRYWAEVGQWEQEESEQNQGRFKHMNQRHDDQLCFECCLVVCATVLIWWILINLLVQTP